MMLVLGRRAGRTAGRNLMMSILVGSLLGCAGNVDKTRLCANDEGEFYTCNDLPLTQTNVVQHGEPDGSLFSTPLHFQLLSDYTEQMAADLKQDLAGTVIKDTIVVASFVYLDATLRSTSHLGNQLAEFLINDLQGIGLPVSDQRLSKKIVINAAGDFALSRDMVSLELGRDIGYVLVGTMLENDKGLVLNARLVSTRTKKVAAATSRLLPKSIFSGS